MFDFINVIYAILPDLLVKEKVTQHNSILTGALYYAELINSENENRFLNAARMNKETFIELLKLLTIEGKLKNSRTICSVVKSLCFLFANRRKAERFQHITE